MNYEEAFNKMIVDYGQDVLSDIFLVRSILLDYIGSSLIDQILVKAYCNLDRDGNLFTYVSSHSLDESKSHISALIATATRDISVDQYIESVEILLKMTFNDAYVRKSRKSSTAKVAIVARQSKGSPIISNLLRTKNQIGIPKPAIKKAAPVVKKSVDSISIVGVCRELKVDYGATDIKVLKNNKDITKIAISVVRSGTCYLKLNGKFSQFKVFLPNDYYKKIKIGVIAKSIGFDCGRGHKFKVDQFEVATYDCLTSIMCDVDSAMVKQHRGNIIYGGYAKKADLTLTKEKTHCSFKTSSPVCNLSVAEKDRIEVEFISYKVKPKINRFLRKIKRVKGYYHLGRQPIKLDMLCEQGIIYVH